MNLDDVDVTPLIATDSKIGVEIPVGETDVRRPALPLNSFNSESEFGRKVIIFPMLVAEYAPKTAPPGASVETVNSSPENKLRPLSTRNRHRSNPSPTAAVVARSPRPAGLNRRQSKNWQE